MSNIFISHSSNDNSFAKKIISYLEEAGHKTIFLDFDPANGIPAGRNWEDELYTKLGKCQAVIVLYSVNFSTSRWCFFEVAHAKAIGKNIIPIRIDDCEIDDILSAIQCIDARTNVDDALRRLQRGLIFAGADKVWNPKDPPYPGLLSFQEQDSSIYFGRETEIEKVLELLRQFKNFGNLKLLLILGASGCGKSSLIRAGVIPRLRKNENSFIIIGPVRPLKTAFLELSKSLANAFHFFNIERKVEDICSILQADSIDNNNFGNGLLVLLTQLAEKSQQADTTFLFFIDQFEELLSGNVENKTKGESDAQIFLSYLRKCIDSLTHKILIIATLRSDFLVKFEAEENLKGLSINDYIVKSPGIESLKTSIIGPAKIAGMDYDNDLPEEMIKDIGSSNALPLFAFTLRELWEQCRHNNLLSVAVYKKEMGGLENAVVMAAEAVLINYITDTRRGEIIRTGEGQIYKLNEEDTLGLKSAFMEMIRIDDEGRYTKKATTWDELPAQVSPLIRKFIDARLLTTWGEEKEVKIEVAHEALFRTWTRLVNWLDESRSFLIWKKRLDVAKQEWEVCNKDKECLLRGVALSEAVQRWDEHKAGKYKLLDEEIEFIKVSHQRKQAKKKIIFAAWGSLFLITLMFIFWLLRLNVEAKNELGKTYFQKSLAAEEGNNFLDALHYNANALTLSNNENITNEIFTNSQALVPHSRLEFIFTHHSDISEAAFNKDGTLILTAGSDSVARIWDAITGMPVGSEMRHSASIEHAIFNPAGNCILTTCLDSTMRIWNARSGALLAGPVKLDGSVEIISFNSEGNKILINAEGIGRLQLFDAISLKRADSLIFRDFHETRKAIFSPDGKSLLLISGSECVLWNSDVTPNYVELTDKGNKIYKAAFSVQGDRIVTSNFDSTVSVWDVRSLKLLGQSQPFEGTAEIVHFSADGHQILAVVNASHTVKVWKVDASFQEQPLGIKHNDFIVRADFNADGSKIITASFDNTAKLWSTGNNNSINNVMKHRNDVMDVVFSPDEKMILTRSMDNTAQLWNAENCSAIGTSMKLNAAVNIASFSPDGKKILVSSNHDSIVQVWKLGSDKDFGLLIKGSPVAIREAVFSEDNKRIIAFGPDQTLLFDAVTGSPIKSRVKYVYGRYLFCFDDDTAKIITSTGEEPIHLWNADKSKKINEKTVEAYFDNYQFSHDGKKMVTYSGDYMQLWDTRSGIKIGEAIRYEISASTEFSLDDTKLYIYSGPDKIQLLDTKTGNRIGEVKKLNVDISQSSVSPDGNKFLVIGYNKQKTPNVWETQIWDLKAGNFITIATDGNSSIRGHEFSPDGAKVALSTGNGSAQLWDTRTGKKIGPLMKHSSNILDEHFNDKGTVLLTIGKDKTVRLWDAGTAAAIGAPIKYDDDISSADFNHEGNRLVIASRNGTVRIWDAKTALPVTAPIIHNRSVRWATFSPDDKKIVSIGADAVIKISDAIGDADIPAELFTLQAQALTGSSLNIETGETIRLSPEEWINLKEQYAKQGAAHYKICKYPLSNWWRYWNPAEALQIRPDVK